MPRADHHATAARLVKVAMARMLYPDNTNWTEPDLAFALHHRMHEVWETTEAIKVIIDAACDEAIGEVVDLIRQAEGVDTVAVDAALGVEPEEGEES